MFCTVCATPNPISARHCGGCGIGLRLGAALAGHREAAAARRRRVVSLSLYTIAALSVVAAIAAAYRTYWIEPASWYARAAAAEAAGDFPEAIDGFAAAAGYRDAQARRAALTGAFSPHRATYEAALLALASGRHDEAITLVAPVVRAAPGYTEAVDLLAEARRQRAAELLRQVETAESRRDWLSAERALAELVAIDPSQAAPATRLAALRRDHAPIIFTREHTLFAVGPDGADERLLTDAVAAAWPTWSPDRTRIAFTAQESGGGEIALYLINADGGGLTRLAGDLRPYAGPVWSPDGTRLAYAVLGGGQELMGQSEPDPPSIRVIEVATGHETNVTGGYVVDAYYPTWAPDGQRLAFVTRAPDNATLAAETLTPVSTGTGDVFVVTLATGAVANLSAGRIDHPWRVVWSPVDERLLVYTRDPGMSYDRDQARLTLIDALSGELAAVDTEGERITTPVWSPDGRRIAYVADERTIVVRTIDRPDEPPVRVQLDTSISRFLSWSLDGQTLLAAAESSGRTSFLIPLDGSGAAPAPLWLGYDSDRHQAGAPQWAPLHPATPAEAPTIAGTGLDRS